MTCSAFVGRPRRRIGTVFSCCGREANPAAHSRTSAGSKRIRRECGSRIEGGSAEGFRCRSEWIVATAFLRKADKSSMVHNFSMKKSSTNVEAHPDHCPPGRGATAHAQAAVRLARKKVARHSESASPWRAPFCAWQLSSDGFWEPCGVEGRRVP